MADQPDDGKIMFPDGNWWQIKTRVTRGMRKQFRQAPLKSMSGALRQNAMDTSNPDSVREALLRSPDSWDINAIDDAYLLHGTSAWSWSEPITQASIDAKDDMYSSLVLDKMRALYAEPTEKERDAFFGKPLPPT